MVSCCLFITSSEWLSAEQIVNNAVKSGSTDHISLRFMPPVGLCIRSEKRFGCNVTFNQREQVDPYLVVGDYKTFALTVCKKLEIYLIGFQES